MAIVGLDYATLQKDKAQGRLRRKLAAKKSEAAAVEAAEGTADEPPAALVNADEEGAAPAGKATVAGAKSSPSSTAAGDGTCTAPPSPAPTAATAAADADATITATVSPTPAKEDGKPATAVTAPPTSLPAPSPAPALTREEAAAQAIALIQAEQERLAAKAAAGGGRGDGGGGAVGKSAPPLVTADMKTEADRVCKVGKVSVTTADGCAQLEPRERAKLNAAIGNGKNQAVRAWTNAEDVRLEIDESVVSHAEGAVAALVFHGCKRCRFVVKAYCAKVFVRHCEEVEIILDESCRILTATVEVERCRQLMLRVRTRLCTLQVEQCQSTIVDIAGRDCFGNGSMLHKGDQFGYDGMLIHAGCDDLRLRVGEDVLICDFALEARLDRTIDRERTQFKVHYDSLNRLISEKVTRLRNGFPSTQREEDEFERRENAKVQALAERMGVAIRRKEEVVGARLKPNEPCPCGSGKKHKKCCRT